MTRFLEWEYNILQNAYMRAKHTDRVSLLKKNTHRETKDRPIFVTTCSTEAEQIKQIIKKNWGIIDSDGLLSQAFPEPPLISFRCLTLQDKLVDSYLKPNYQQLLGTRPNGCYKCHHCSHCDHVCKPKFFRMLYP